MQISIITEKEIKLTLNKNIVIINIKFGQRYKCNPIYFIGHNL